MSQTNFALAKWSAQSGNDLIARRDGDAAEYRIQPMRPAELLFRVRRDGEYYRTLRLATSGTLQERELYRPGVQLDREWFDECTLEITLPDVVESRGY